MNGFKKEVIIIKILVTGGSGFIGSHLVEYLTESGHEIFIVDRKPALLSNFNRVNFFKRDISCSEDFDDIMPNIDIVYHLASNSNVRDTASDEKDTIGTTISLLESMRKHNVYNLIFTSSSAIYGIGAVAWYENSHATPISSYGKAKRFSEKLIESACLEWGLNATVLRLANVVGKNQTHGVLFDFYQKLQHDPSLLKIMGNGKQTKEYIHISDILSSINLVSKRLHSFEIYNVSSSTPLNVIEIADIICSEMGLLNVKYVTEREEYGWVGDVPYYSLDTSKLKSLGWICKFNSKSAVQRTVHDFLSIFNQEGNK
ncbi:MAG: NAD-dependent epimerase/dehydratase family protein [Methanosarcinales archaeon]|jgi:UDP-glucose 4-epimerase|nr:NAD-dependent epimerase/dehydratase family protein [Methanosarcinales archaeon]